MDLQPTLARLAAIDGRSAGTDAERRAARALAAELRAGGREAHVETIWVRPRWALAHALHALVALAGSVVSVDRPELGLGLAAAALVSLVGDLSGRLYLARLLTQRRATQNVVSPAPGELEARAARGAPAVPRVRLVVTAALDMPRGGLLRRIDAALGGRALLALAVATALVALAAAVRVGGVDDRWLGAVQLAPTLVLLLGLAALVDAILAEPLRGSNASSGPALALALVRSLDAAPPRNLGVEVVLAGAGDSAGALGLRAYLRARRREVGVDEVAVVHLEPGGAGSPCWWTGDGLLVRLRFHPQLQRLAARVATGEAHLRAAPYRGRGATGALAARRARRPSIAIGARDGGDPAVATADPAALRATLELAVALVAALDADLERD